MNYFIKAKFPAGQTSKGDLVQRVPAKFRTDDRAKAFEWIAQQLADGAASVTIRPE